MARLTVSEAKYLSFPRPNFLRNDRVSNVRHRHTVMTVSIGWYPGYPLSRNSKNLTRPPYHCPGRKLDCIIIII